MSKSKLSISDERAILLGSSKCVGRERIEKIAGVMTKKCRKCDDPKPLTQFHKNKRAADGHVEDCKACVKVYVEQKKEKGKVFLEQRRAKKEDMQKKEKIVKKSRIMTKKTEKLLAQPVGKSRPKCAYNGCNNLSKDRAIWCSQHTVRSTDHGILG